MDTSFTDHAIEQVVDWLEVDESESIPRFNLLGPLPRRRDAGCRSIDMVTE